MKIALQISGYQVWNFENSFWKVGLAILIEIFENFEQTSVYSHFIWKINILPAVRNVHCKFIQYVCTSH